MTVIGVILFYIFFVLIGSFVGYHLQDDKKENKYVDFLFNYIISGFFVVLAGLVIFALINAYIYSLM
jgi:hypothetical protein